MKKIICLIAATVMMAFSFTLAYAESEALTYEQAIALMDTLENREFDAAWERKEFQKENDRHTREWEAVHGPCSRWRGDVVAAYVLEYGLMPTHDAPYANPLAVLPGPDALSESAARSLAMDAVAKVEKRLPLPLLDAMEYTWGFYYSRDLDWFWEPAGTWIFSWYQEGKQVCMAYISDAHAKVTIIFDYLDRTPDDEGIHIFTDF